MKDVFVFTTQTWPHCRTAKEFLSKNNIHYVEKDVNKDMNARNEMIKRNINGVPAFLIGDDLVVGLDTNRILQLVDHRVVECPNCHKKVRVPLNMKNFKIKCPNCKTVLDI